MKNLVIVIVFIAGILMSNVGYSQSGCPNLNFSYANFTHWQCYAGTCSNGVTIINPSPAMGGRHTIMNETMLLLSNQLQDEECPAISKVPSGFGYAVRLGNNSTGAYMEAIEYTLTVDNTNSLLLLHYAWVMEDPGHAPSDQPQFTITVKDTSGNILNVPCGYPGFGDPIYLTGLACNGSVQARDWTTRGFDMRDFIGQTLKIYFETRDCTQGEHFGYAYIVPECRPMEIDVQNYCETSSVLQLSAPEGFGRYKWTRSSDPLFKHQGVGEPYRSYTCTDPIENEVFTCEVENELYCYSTIQTVIARTDIDADFGYGVKDENGEVDFYSHGYDNWYDTCNRTVTFVDLSVVYNSKKDDILWEIEGTNIVSRDSLFTHTFPNPDTATIYNIRLSIITEHGCTDTISQSIIIYPEPKLSIRHPNTFFTDRKDTLTALFEGQFSSYQWWWTLCDGSKGSSYYTNPLIVENAGTYWIEAQADPGCLLTDTVRISDLKPFFRYGVMESGFIDFASHNNENWYDTCTRTLTFVDSSMLCNTTVRSRLWEITGTIHLTSSNPEFTVTFPDEEQPQTYLIRLRITTADNYSDVYQDSITIFPVSKVEVDLSRTMNVTGSDTLTAISLHGNFVSYRWTWQLRSGSSGTDTGGRLILTAPWTVCFLRAEDDKGCYASDTIWNADTSSFVGEYTQGLCTLGQNIPNPAGNSIVIPYSVPTDGSVTFNVYSISGQVLYSQMVETTFGSHSIDLNTSDLSAGLYFYSMEFKGQRIVKRMVIKQ